MTTQTSEASHATHTQKARTYKGSCHCGAVHFEARLDLGAGIGKCNCSICKRANLLGAKVKPEDMRILSGEDALTDYQFNTKSVHHLFCKTCGVRPFGRANIPQAGGEYYTVNVHCLEDNAVLDLAGIPVRYYDGKNNNWWNDAAPFP